MKRLFLLALACITPLLWGGAFAQSGTIDRPPTSLSDVFRYDNDNPTDAGQFTGTGLRDYALPTREGFTADQTNAGQYQFRFLVERALDFIKRALIPIAMILTAITGLILITNRSDEQAFTKAKNIALTTGAGFAFFTLSIFFVDQVFFGFGGELITTDAGAEEIGKRFVDQMEGILNWGSTFVVGIATLMIILSGVQIMLSGGSEEGQTGARTRITWALVGIFIIVITRTVFELLTIRGGELTQPALDGILSQIGGWTNFALGFVAFLAFVSLVYAGIRMVTSFGDEQTQTIAKSIIRGVVIAILLSFLAFALVTFFIRVF